MHTFVSDFYGRDMKAVVLGYIRPELDYTSRGAPAACPDCGRSPNNSERGPDRGYSDRHSRGRKVAAAPRVSEIFGPPAVDKALMERG
jgi:hypothetical protein